MKCDRLVRVDGLQLSNCLFAYGQAWAKLERGDEDGATAAMRQAQGAVPPGTVALITSMITRGEMPVPGPDGKWLDQCRDARAGRLTLSLLVCSDQAAHERAVAADPTPRLRATPVTGSQETEPPAEVNLGGPDSKTGLYGELPPGIGPLMDLASALIHQAFTAHKSGDLAACDAFITEGQNACGGVFQMNAEYVVRWPNHTGDQAWMAFLAHLATRTGPLSPEIPASPRQVESEAEFRERLDRIVAGDGRRPPGEPHPSPPPSPELPPVPREEDPDLSKPGALAEELRKMGLM